MEIMWILADIVAETIMLITNYMLWIIVGIGIIIYFSKKKGITKQK